MKKIILSFPALLIMFCCLAKNPGDSLRQVFSSAAPDTLRIHAALGISALEKNVDSAYHWADRAYLLSRSVRIKKGEAGSLMQLGNVYLKAGNLSRSLEYFLRSAALYEKLEDRHELYRVYRSTGRIFSLQGDKNTALAYYHKGVALLKDLGDDPRVMYFPIGSVYEQLGRFDSALYYYQRSYEYTSSLPGHPGLTSVLGHLGTLHAKMNNLPLALTYGKMATESYEKYNRNDESSVYVHLAEIFLKAGNRDSAIYYSEISYAIGERLQSREMRLEAAKFLSGLYENNDRLAVKYFRIASALQDSLYSSEQAAAITNLQFNEKQRQMELERTRKEEAGERRQIIQFAGIAIGLICFGIIFLMLSQSIIVNERLIRFVGILALLMVFEFINLVLHPFIGSLTHHSPILMLIILVGIASLLIPFHHKLEQWVKNKLVEKNKRIRLEAARQTIAKLEKSAPVAEGGLIK